MLFFLFLWLEVVWGLVHLDAVVFPAVGVDAELGDVDLGGTGLQRDLAAHADDVSRASLAIRIDEVDGLVKNGSVKVGSKECGAFEAVAGWSEANSIGVWCRGVPALPSNATLSVTGVVWVDGVGDVEFVARDAVHVEEIESGFLSTSATLLANASRQETERNAIGWVEEVGVVVGFPLKNNVGSVEVGLLWENGSFGGVWRELELEGYELLNGGEYGWSLCGVGDLDEDGRGEEMLIGAPGENSEEGGLYVVWLDETCVNSGKCGKWVRLEVQWDVGGRRRLGSAMVWAGGKEVIVGAETQGTVGSVVWLELRADGKLHRLISVIGRAESASGDLLGSSLTLLPALLAPSSCHKPSSGVGVGKKVDRAASLPRTAWTTLVVAASGEVNGRELWMIDLYSDESIGDWVAVDERKFGVEGVEQVEWVGDTDGDGSGDEVIVLDKSSTLHLIRFGNNSITTFPLTTPPDLSFFFQVPDFTNDGLSDFILTTTSSPSTHTFHLHQSSNLASSPSALLLNPISATENNSTNSSLTPTPTPLFLSTNHIPLSSLMMDPQGSYQTTLRFLLRSPLTTPPPSIMFNKRSCTNLTISTPPSPHTSPHMFVATCEGTPPGVPGVAIPSIPTHPTIEPSAPSHLTFATAQERLFWMDDRTSQVVIESSEAEVVEVVGDWDGDGKEEVIVGLPEESLARGSIHVYLTLSSSPKEVFPRGGTSLAIFNSPGARFGASIALLGDLNTDGSHREVAVGAPGIESGRGGVAILFFTAEGTLDFATQITASLQPTLNSLLFPKSAFGTSLFAVGDINKDGLDWELAVGVPGNDPGDDVAVVVVFLSEEGEFVSHWAYNTLEGIAANSSCGTSLSGGHSSTQSTFLLAGCPNHAVESDVQGGIQLFSVHFTGAIIVTNFIRFTQEEFGSIIGLNAMVAESMVMVSPSDDPEVDSVGVGSRTYLVSARSAHSSTNPSPHPSLLVCSIDKDYKFSLVRVAHFPPSLSSTISTLSSDDRALFVTTAGDTNGDLIPDWYMVIPRVGVYLLEGRDNAVRESGIFLSTHHFKDAYPESLLDTFDPRYPTYNPPLQTRLLWHGAPDIADLIKAFESKEIQSTFLDTCTNATVSPSTLPSSVVVTCHHFIMMRHSQALLGATGLVDDDSVGDLRPLIPAKSMGMRLFRTMDIFRDPLRRKVDQVNDETTVWNWDEDSDSGIAIAAGGDLDGSGEFRAVVFGSPSSSRTGMVFVCEIDPALIPSSSGLSYLFGIEPAVGAYSGDVGANINGLGSSIAWIGDVNSDFRRNDLAVGAPLSWGHEGAVVLMTLGVDGSPTHAVQLSRTTIPELKGEAGHFGSAVSAGGDVDGDGNDLEIWVGGSQTSSNEGGVWLVHLLLDGGVQKVEYMDAAEFGIEALSPAYLGASVVGNFLEKHFFVGAPGIQSVLYCKHSGNEQVQVVSTIRQGIGILAYRKVTSDFGRALAYLGEPGEGFLGEIVLAVGDPVAKEVSFLWITEKGSVEAFETVSAELGNKWGTVELVNEFGRALASAGDLNGDGQVDVWISDTSASSLFMVQPTTSNKRQAWLQMPTSKQLVTPSAGIGPLYLDPRGVGGLTFVFQGSSMLPLSSPPEIEIGFYTCTNVTSATLLGDVDGASPYLQRVTCHDKIGGEVLQDADVNILPERDAALKIKLPSNSFVFFNQESFTAFSSSNTLSWPPTFGDITPAAEVILSSAPLGDANEDQIANEVVFGVMAGNGDVSRPCDAGEVWVSTVNDGEVDILTRISPCSAGIGSNYTGYGTAVAYMGDLDLDGHAREFLVGCPSADGGFGAVRVEYLDSSLSHLPSRSTFFQVASFSSAQNNAGCGAALTVFDSNMDGRTAEVAVGCPGGDDGGVAIIFLRPDGTVSNEVVVSSVSSLSGEGVGHAITLLQDPTQPPTAINLAKALGSTYIAVGSPDADETGKMYIAVATESDADNTLNPVYRGMGEALLQSNNSLGFGTKILGPFDIDNDGAARELFVSDANGEVIALWTTLTGVEKSIRLPLRLDDGGARLIGMLPDMQSTGQLTLAFSPLNIQTSTRFLPVPDLGGMATVGTSSIVLGWMPQATLGEVLSQAPIQFHRPAELQLIKLDPSGRDPQRRIFVVAVHMHFYNPYKVVKERNMSHVLLVDEQPCASTIVLPVSQLPPEVAATMRSYVYLVACVGAPPGRPSSNSLLTLNIFATDGKKISSWKSERLVRYDAIPAVEKCAPIQVTDALQEANLASLITDFTPQSGTMMSYGGMDGNGTIVVLGNASPTSSVALLLLWIDPPSLTPYKVLQLHRIDFGFSPDSKIGFAVEALSDLNGNGDFTELAVGAPGYSGTGKFVIVDLNLDGTIKMISSSGIGAEFSDTGMKCGTSLSHLGFAMYDGFVDTLAVGCPMVDGDGKVLLVAVAADSSHVIKKALKSSDAEGPTNFGTAVLFAGNTINNFGGYENRTLIVSRTTSSMLNGAGFEIFPDVLDDDRDENPFVVVPALRKSLSSMLPNFAPFGHTIIPLGDLDGKHHTSHYLLPSPNHNLVVEFSTLGSKVVVKPFDLSKAAKDACGEALNSLQVGFVGVPFDWDRSGASDVLMINKNLTQLYVMLSNDLSGSPALYSTGNLERRIRVTGVTTPQKVAPVFMLERSVSSAGPRVSAPTFDSLNSTITHLDEMIVALHSSIPDLTEVATLNSVRVSGRSCMHASWVNDATPSSFQIPPSRFRAFAKCVGIPKGPSAQEAFVDVVVTLDEPWIDGENEISSDAALLGSWSIAEKTAWMEEWSLLHPPSFSTTGKFAEGWGSSMAHGADIRGDGTANDVLVGDKDRDRVSVVMLSDSSVGFEEGDGDVDSIVVCFDAVDTLLNGENLTFSNVGQSVAWADVDGDGEVTEALIGAPAYSTELLPNMGAVVIAWVGADGVATLHHLLKQSQPIAQRFFGHFVLAVPPAAPWGPSVDGEDLVPISVGYRGTGRGARGGFAIMWVEFSADNSAMSILQETTYDASDLSPSYFNGTQVTAMKWFGNVRSPLAETPLVLMTLRGADLKPLLHIAKVTPLGEGMGAGFLPRRSIGLDEVEGGGAHASSYSRIPQGSVLSGGWSTFGDSLSFVGDVDGDGTALDFVAPSFLTKQIVIILLTMNIELKRVVVIDGRTQLVTPDWVWFGMSVEYVGARADALGDRGELWLTTKHRTNSRRFAILRAKLWRNPPVVRDLSSTAYVHEACSPTSTISSTPCKPIQPLSANITSVNNFEAIRMVIRSPVEQAGIDQGLEVLGVSLGGVPCLEAKLDDTWLGVDDEQKLQGIICSGLLLTKQALEGDVGEGDIEVSFSSIRVTYKYHDGTMITDPNTGVLGQTHGMSRSEVFDGPLRGFPIKVRAPANAVLHPQIVAIDGTLRAAYTTRVTLYLEDVVVRKLDPSADVKVYTEHEGSTRVNDASNFKVELRNATTEVASLGGAWLHSFSFDILPCFLGWTVVRVELNALGGTMETDPVSLPIATPKIESIKVIPRASNLPSAPFLDPLGGTLIEITGNGFGEFDLTTDKLAEHCRSHGMFGVDSQSPLSDSDSVSSVAFAILVGLRSCQSVVWVSDTRLHCVAPPGLGTNIPLAVVIDGLVVLSPTNVSYAPPRPVTWVSPDSNVGVGNEVRVAAPVISSSSMRVSHFEIRAIRFGDVGEFDMAVDVNYFPLDAEGVAALRSGGGRRDGDGSTLLNPGMVKVNAQNDMGKHQVKICIVDTFSLPARHIELYGSHPSSTPPTPICSEVGSGNDANSIWRGMEAAWLEFVPPKLDRVTPNVDLDLFGGESVELIINDVHQFVPTSSVVATFGGVPCATLSRLSGSKFVCTTPPLKGTTAVVQVDVLGSKSNEVLAGVLLVSILGITPTDVLPAAPEAGVKYSFTLTVFGVERVAFPFIGGILCSSPIITPPETIECLDIPAPSDWATDDVWLLVEGKVNPVSQRPLLRAEPTPSIIGVDVGSSLSTSGDSSILVFGEGIGSVNSTVLRAVTFGGSLEDSKSLVLGQQSTAQTPFATQASPALCKFHRLISRAQVQVILPPGVGANIPLRFHLTTLLVSDPFLISYTPPQVTSVTPSIVLPRLGESSAVLCGSNFVPKVYDEEVMGEVSIEIVIGGIDCDDASPLNGSCVVCNSYHTPGAIPDTPPFTWPSPGSVEVRVEGQSSGVTFGLVTLVEPPSLSATSPTEAGPGDVIRLLGSGLGSGEGDLKQVEIDGEICASVEWVSESEVRCEISTPHPTWDLAMEEDIVVPFVYARVVLQSGVVTNSLQFRPKGLRHREAPFLTVTTPRAWRPLGQPGTLVLWWNYVSEEEELSQLVGSTALAATDFDIEVVEVNKDISTSFQSKNKEATSVRRTVARVKSSDLEDTYTSRIAVPWKNPVYVRVRSSNGDGASEWVYLHPTAAPLSSLLGSSIPSNCLQNQYLATQYASVGKSDEGDVNYNTLDKVVCESCPVGAVCGGLPSHNVTAKQGYWRVPWAPHSLGFARCESDLHCLGYSGTLKGDIVIVAGTTSTGNKTSKSSSGKVADGDSDDDDDGVEERVPVAVPNLVLLPTNLERCRVGHRGVLCSACEPGYFYGVSQTCETCGDPLWIGVRFVLLLIAVAVALTVLLLRAWHVRRLPSSKVVIIAKIVLVHLQQISVLGSVQLRWPAVAEDFFRFVDITSSFTTSGLALDCLLGEQSRSPYARTAVILTMPLWLILFAAILWGVYGIWERRRGAGVVGPPTTLGVAGGTAEDVEVLPPPPKTCCERISRTTWSTRMILSCTVIAFLVHTPLSMAAFRLLTCRIVAPEGDPSNRQLRLAMDLSVRCDDPVEQRAMYAIGGSTIFIVSFGLPIASAVFLSRIGAMELQRMEWREKFSFLISGFRRHLYWFESVTLLRKVFLAATTTLLAPSGGALQITVAFLVVFLAQLIHAQFKPYTSGVLNALEAFSLVTAALTLVGGVFVVLDDAGGISSEKPGSVAVSASYFVAIVNCLFFCTALALLSKRATRTVQRGIEWVTSTWEQHVGVQSLLDATAIQFGSFRKSKAATSPPKLVDNPLLSLEDLGEESEEEESEEEGSEEEESEEDESVSKIDDLLQPETRRISMS